MKHIVIINGPNLNLLGVREPEIYGSTTFEDYFKHLTSLFPDVKLDYVQSNIEGELIDALQQYGFKADGIVFNPAGYTHTSVAIGDAVAAINTAVIEVHISNVHQRETFRHTSYIAPHCKGSIIGLGLKGYELAIRSLLDL